MSRGGFVGTGVRAGSGVPVGAGSAVGLVPPFDGVGVAWFAGVAVGQRPGAGAVKAGRAINARSKV
jgi:hypothetical protein